MCFVTAPILLGYNENKTSYGSKNRKRGMVKIYCSSLESKRINFRESTIQQMIDKNLLMLLLREISKHH